MMSFGTEEDKIGFGYEMFNTSKKKEMNFEDFFKSYKDLMYNWSVLLGEKFILKEGMVRSIFAKIDKEGKGIINETE
jgi:hypothetical protein